MFDLIMISNYMDQSLILLKNELKNDFITRTTVFVPPLLAFGTIGNIDMVFRSNDSKALLSDELKAQIRSWNRADSALFDAVNFFCMFCHRANLGLIEEFRHSPHPSIEWRRCAHFFFYKNGQKLPKWAKLTFWPSNWSHLNTFLVFLKDIIFVEIKRRNDFKF